MKSLYKNERYKILDSNSTYLLIDMDSELLGFICFLFNWIIPQKAYIVAEREADDLITQGTTHNSKENLLGRVVFPFLIAVSIIIPILLLNLDVDIYTILFLNLGIISISLIVIRFVVSMKNKHINGMNFKKYAVSIRLRPHSMRYCAQAIGVYLLFLSLSVLCIFLYVILNGYWVISLAYSIVLYFFLLTNRLAYNTKKYTISIRN